MEKKFSACISIKRLYEIFYTDSSEKESKLELSMAPHNANDTRKALSEEAKKIAKERKTWKSMQSKQWALSAIKKTRSARHQTIRIYIETNFEIIESNVCEANRKSEKINTNTVNTLNSLNSIHAEPSPRVPSVPLKNRIILSHWCFLAAASKWKHFFSLCSTMSFFAFSLVFLFLMAKAFRSDVCESNRNSSFAFTCHFRFVGTCVCEYFFNIAIGCCRDGGGDGGKPYIVCRCDKNQYSYMSCTSSANRFLSAFMYLSKIPLNVRVCAFGLKTRKREHFQWNRPKTITTRRGKKSCNWMYKRNQY